MMKSLYSGVAGLKVHNQRMDVVGNNISNVNTVGYKASTTTFKDIFYQNKTYSSSGDAVSGGRNSNQIGYGASLGAIQQVMTQSGFKYTDEETDCAIQGEGFFQVMDVAGNIYYTRNGHFHIDNVGNLCDAQGNIVLGVSGDPTNIDASSNRINLYVPPIDNRAASVTKTYKNGHDEYTYTVSANTYGDEGNISITIMDIKESESPFATQNGKLVTVYMELDQEFKNEADFNNAIQEAMEAGGIAFDSEVLPITFDFESLPSDADILANKASCNLKHTFAATTDGGPGGNIDLTFTADEAGDFANAYEINIVSANVDKVVARWMEDVLTITIPSTKATSAADIQTAINDRAGDNNAKKITVGGTGSFTADQAEYMRTEGTTLRVGMANGRNNFFKNVAEAMDTIKLTGGTIAAEQTTKDLESIFIDDDGVIYGVHTIHGTIAMGRIDIVTFENPTGLDQVGLTYWKPSLSSGDPELKKPNELGAGAIVSGALELSNADLSEEISDMIITQRGFQANSRVITVTDTMLEELVNLKR